MNADSSIIIYSLKTGIFLEIAREAIITSATQVDRASEKTGNIKGVFVYDTNTYIRC